MLTRDLCPIFLAHCSNERHLAPNTMAAYRQDLAELCARLGDVNIADISPERLVEYVSYLLQERRLAPATVKRRIACTKSMFRWICRRSYRSDNPFERAEIRVRIPDRLPRCLNGEDTARLLREAERAHRSTKLAVNLLFATGARVSELSSVRLGDIDMSSGTIRITGKGNRERQVFLGNNNLAADLNRYLELMRPQARREDRLLVGQRGRPLTSASIRGKVKALSRKAGLERAVTPHVLRHTTATTLIERGVDIRFVQRLLGHRSITTTQIYTHVSDQALRSAVFRADIFENCCPRG